jgi:hypothetical protein
VVLDGITSSEECQLSPTANGLVLGGDSPQFFSQGDYQVTHILVEETRFSLKNSKNPIACNCASRIRLS